ncbi:MAG: nitroreductase family protein [Prevotella sp.]|jgi:nitroreductase|nr:nitroreductase family protein [Prevotella sp.]
MQIKNIVNESNHLLVMRASIRRYDDLVKIDREEMSNILQDAMTAPSSFNLQPWRFFVFDTPEGKELIKPYMMFNQLQWETSAAVIAIFGDMDSYSAAEKILSANVNFSLMTEDYKTQMLEIISSYRDSYTDERLRDSILLDCGFVAMQLMLSAKAYGYETNPIGGFMRKELTKALELDEKRYIPVLLVSIGKAAEKAKDTVRFSVGDITVWR